MPFMELQFDQGLENDPVWKIEQFRATFIRPNCFTTQAQ